MKVPLHKERTCEGCGKKFLARRSGFRWQQYCNNACYKSKARFTNGGAQ